MARPYTQTKAGSRSYSIGDRRNPVGRRFRSRSCSGLCQNSGLMRSSRPFRQRLDIQPARWHRPILHPAVIVGALGYFVDIYDLILFAVVRVASLKDLGCTADQLVTQGTHLINMQMGGMLLGGVLWGLLGDRVGRIKVLFGSIILYSLANIANGFVHGIDAYAVCRFFAGLGLAGELGGCVTLVAEVLPRELRGYGTVMISAVGILGAVAAGYVGTWFHWRMAYYIGGGLGIALLFLRLCVAESGLFRTMNETNRPPFGSQLRLLLAPSRLGRYLVAASSSGCPAGTSSGWWSSSARSSPRRLARPAPSPRPSPWRSAMRDSPWEACSAAA